MICEKCGYEIPKGKKFCPNCGYSIKDKVRKIPIGIIIGIILLLLLIIFITFPVFSTLLKG